MHILLWMTKHLFGQCRQGSKLGKGYVAGNHARDDIDRFKKSKC